MPGSVDLYPPRRRETNVELIRKLITASNQHDFELADTALAENLHPSLLAELDWMEMTHPEGHTPAIRNLVDGFFLAHLPAILRLRKSELDLPDDALRQLVGENRDFFDHLGRAEPGALAALGKDLGPRVERIAAEAAEPAPPPRADPLRAERDRIEHRFAAIEDPHWIPLAIDVEIQNALALALDSPLSRMRAKTFLRDCGGRFPRVLDQEMKTAAELPRIVERIDELAKAAREAKLPRLVAACEAMAGTLRDRSAGSLDAFCGELAAGYGPCGRCSMMYASAAIVCFDPDCPSLIADDTGFIQLSLDFNVGHCPFCGNMNRADTPAVFYSPHRGQVIYNLPRQGRFSREEALARHRPVIETIRARYLERVDEATASAFGRAREDVTYGTIEFLQAIQMGTTSREEHVANLVGLANGTGLLVDRTKGAMIALTPDEMALFDEGARDIDLPTAVRDEGLGGGPEMEKAMACFGRGEYESSRRILSDLLARHPEDRVVRRNLAAACISLGDKAAARRIMEGARG